MNFFEQELRKLARACGGLIDPTFAGRACYGNLGGDNRVKLQFVTQGHADHYDALKATILNRTDGQVDTLLFHFRDVWGKKYDYGYHDGIPHIWTHGGKSEWYGYNPTAADYIQLSAELDSYLAVFTDRPLVAEKESVVEKLRDSKQKATAPREKPVTRGKSTPER